MELLYNGNPIYGRSNVKELKKCKLKTQLPFRRALIYLRLPLPRLFNLCEMRLFNFIVLLLFIVTSSCQPEQTHKLTQQEMEMKVDSMVAAKMEIVNQQAMEDLDHRMAIEVKAKTDSIVNAKLQDAAAH